VLEHVDCEQGREYLELALARRPSLPGELDVFRRNDEIGSPTVCDYGVHGAFSPTTLRYVKALADLVGFFGQLDEARLPDDELHKPAAISLAQPRRAFERASGRTLAAGGAQDPPGERAPGLG
jgi:hypothetical protein